MTGGRLLCRHCRRGNEGLCEQFFALNRLKGQLYDGTTRLPGTSGSPVTMYSMAGFAVVPTTGVFRLPDDIPLECAAVLGRSVFTSYRAVHNIGQARPGSTVVAA